MRITVKSSRRRSHWMVVLFSLVVCLTLVTTPLSQLRTGAQSQRKGQAETPNELGTVAAVGNDSGLSRAGRNAPVPNQPLLAGTDQGVESEPNNTFATADVLTGVAGKIRGALLSGGAPATAGVDPDWYSFTTTVAASKIYAGTVTFGSGQGTTGGAGDTVLEVFATDGTTLLELDDEDGSVGGGNSSSIAGTTLGAPGTYYLRVTNFSTTVPIAPYDLYFAIRDATAPTAETEPNNNGTPQVMPVSQFVSGVIDPVGDSDTFTFTATAGDTVWVSQDLDPERDVTTFNGRVGVGLFGTPSNFLVTSDGGTFDTIDSESFYMTVETTGTYQVYVDSQLAGGGGPTATYNFNVTIIPALPSGTCTTYTNSTPTAIADLALTSSTISIPDSRIIRSLRVVTDITHTNLPDLDVHLRSPLSNDNGLFTDAGTATQTGAQNINLSEQAALPMVFTVLNGVIFRAEPNYRLDWFRGENSLGTWTLDIRDDLTANTGTLNSWSLEVCEEPALTGTLFYSQDFESNNGGYTLGPGVTANEWEYGTPATPATTTANPVAPFLNCASGTNCWKTDLDNTYDINSIQDLTSLNIGPLPAGPGITTLYWQARYQFESISFDRAWVRVTEVANPTHTRLVWNSENATMANTVGNPTVNVPASAGWGRYSGDISDFASQTIQVTFHLESDSTVNFGGWAIDDVQIRTANPTAANGTVSGRITDPNGVPVDGVVVQLNGTQNRKFITDANGNYTFEDVETNGFYSVTPSMANYRFSPESRSFSLVGNHTEAAFTATRDSVMGVNRIDTPEYFVRQHYLDFLNREPDESGFNFWSDQILSCGADAACAERRAINVSAAYFLSIEFHETGRLVDGLYRASYGRRPTYVEFVPDSATVGRGVIVGRADWARQLEANKQAFVAAFVQRAEFQTAYGGMSNAGYVDALISHTGVDFSQSERNALVDALNASSLTRADALRQIAEDGRFVAAKRNEAFVMMQYFGYLRREPDASGYAFWLNKLNQFGGNFEQAEMVKAFIVSGEYRDRFRQ